MIFFLENSSKSESEVIVTDSEEHLDENWYSSDSYDTAPQASNNKQRGFEVVCNWG
jgi:hypothetical protein